MKPAAVLTVCLLACSLTLFAAQSSNAQALDGTQQFADLGTCKLESGEQIANCRIGYRTWGKLNADSSNAILFPTWFTWHSADIAGFVGANNLVDPAKYFLIAVDALGDGVSSSPSTSKTQPRMQFPAFTTHDMVATEHRLATETLHLKHLHAVMGISMGGMQTFQWIVQYPEFMDLAIPIVGSTRLTAYDLVLWHGEEDAVRTDPAWRSGNYEKNPAIFMAHILHDMNLTTPEHYAGEVTREGFPARYVSYGLPAPESTPEFDTNDRIYQLEAMIHHDIASGGRLEDAAKLVKARVLVIPSQQDHMVNPAPAIEFAKLIGAKTFLLTSNCGHIAFVCEGAKFNPVVEAFLDSK
jgi:homoserine O-acetyltransferase